MRRDREAVFAYKRATFSVVIARFNRATQYSETSVMESRRHGVLDRPIIGERKRRRPSDGYVGRRRLFMEWRSQAPGKREEEWWARKSFAHPTICPSCRAASAPLSIFLLCMGLFSIFLFWALSARPPLLRGPLTRIAGQSDLSPQAGRGKLRRPRTRLRYPPRPRQQQSGQSPRGRKHR
jgi:hypothetical protein